MVFGFLVLRTTLICFYTLLIAANGVGSSVLVSIITFFRSLLQFPNVIVISRSDALCNLCSLLAVEASIFFAFSILFEVFCTCFVLVCSSCVISQGLIRLNCCIDSSLYVLKALVSPANSFEYGKIYINSKNNYFCNA